MIRNRAFYGVGGIFIPVFKEEGCTLIEVKVRENRIQVSGHAGHAPPGQDIVCAGVTALIQTLAESIRSLTEDTVTYERSPGRADIYYGNLSEKACILIDSFFIGICMIAGEFPDNVRVI